VLTKRRSSILDRDPIAPLVSLVSNILDLIRRVETLGARLRLSVGPLPTPTTLRLRLLRPPLS